MNPNDQPAHNEEIESLFSTPEEAQAYLAGLDEQTRRQLLERDNELAERTLAVFRCEQERQAQGISRGQLIRQGIKVSIMLVAATGLMGYAAFGGGLFVRGNSPWWNPFARLMEGIRMVRLSGAEQTREYVVHAWQYLIMSGIECIFWAAVAYCLVRLMMKLYHRRQLNLTTTIPETQ